MLVFVIPLMSPKVAKSWEHACKLLERTVKSVCNQTSSNFRVVVVCNEKPNIEFNHDHLTYLEVDLPLPELTIKGKTLDRGYKVLKGLIWAGELAPSHVMAVDADDCVSKYLAEFVEQNNQSDGWFIKKGYVYQDGKSIVYFRKNFYKICGTCNIVNYKLYDLCETSESSSENFIWHYHGGHKYILQHLTEKGSNIKPLPFIGATYIVENGENYYNDNFNRLMRPQQMISYIKSLKNYRPLTNSIRKEFGLYNINQNPIDHNTAKSGLRGILLSESHIKIL